MEITRTAKIKVNMPFAEAQAYINRCTEACNVASQIAFGLKCPSSATKLHVSSYQTIRGLGISGQVSASVIRVVASKYMALKKKMPLKPVVFRGEAVPLQGGERGRDFRFTKDGKISITTLAGRGKFDYSAPPSLQTYLDPKQAWRLGGAKLFVRKSKVFLAVSFSKTAEAVTDSQTCVIGVDRGLKYIAVATDGKRQIFLGGGKTRVFRAQYLNTRSSLQSRKAKKNTRSVRKVLQRLAGREKRFGIDVDHCISKKLIAFASKSGCPVISFENLKGICKNAGTGKRTKDCNKRLHRWSFYRLETFTSYKAQTLGFSMIAVDPRHTSQGCSRCGHTERANRNGLRFKCKACGYELHADLNAGRNVRLRGILARQGLSKDGVPSITPQVHSSPELQDSGQEGDKLHP